MAKTTKEMIEVMQAFERGEKVEAKDKVWIKSEWEEVKGPCWDWGHFDYRVAPKPKKQIKMLCFIKVCGELVWVREEKSSAYPSSYVRVPSEDKIIEVDE